MEQAANPKVAITTPKRALLAEIDFVNKTRYGLKNATQLPGYIRSEVVLGQGNSLQFPIRTDEQANGLPVFPTENRLNINDAFFITDYSVMFQTFTTAGGDAARKRAPLNTFPNEAVFGLNTPELEGAYNGRISLRVDDTVYIDSMDVNRFRNVGTAQRGLEVSTGATTPAYTDSAWSQREAFANEVDPLVRLNGPGKNVFTMTFPDNLAFNKEAAQTMVAVLYLRGWLSQNGGAMRSIG